MRKLIRLLPLGVVMLIPFLAWLYLGEEEARPERERGTVVRETTLRRGMEPSIVSAVQWQERELIPGKVYDADADPVESSAYGVQIRAERRLQDALRLARRYREILHEEVYLVRLTDGSEVPYKLRVGMYETLRFARAKAEQLQEEFSKYPEEKTHLGKAFPVAYPNP